MHALALGQNPTRGLTILHNNMMLYRRMMAGQTNKILTDFVMQHGISTADKFMLLLWFSPFVARWGWVGGGIKQIHQ